MSAKGKLFRSSPLCSSEADDITDNENDEEVVAIFQRSQPVGWKRSAHEDELSQPVGGKRSAHEDEESSFPESAAKPTNVTGKLFVVFEQVFGLENLL